MYENGKRVNGYQKKRLHKNKTKEKYAKWYWNFYSWENVDRYFNNRWGESPKYWKMFYLSGCRKYAKENTNSILRSNGKQICHKVKCFDIEEIERFPQYSTYRKYEDYYGILW